MKKKDERETDLGLKQLGVAPRIYYFDTYVEPFTAITIACEMMTRPEVRGKLDAVIYQDLPFYQHEKATRCRQRLRKNGIWGVARCDQRDSVNRRRGRTIAKGRLWKHLKQEKGE
jgi:hypothetical protein